MKFRDGLPQTYDEHHINHCLVQLRSDVLCYADDTPRVTTLVNVGNPSPKLVLIRQRTTYRWNRTKLDS